MEINRFPHNRRLVWTTRDGKEIPVDEMTESHIKNCMRMIGEEDELYNYFLYELAYRNDDRDTMLSIHCPSGVIQFESKTGPDGDDYWDDYWERNTY